MGARGRADAWVQIGDREVRDLLDELTYRVSRLPLWQSACDHVWTLMSRADLARFRDHDAAFAAGHHGLSRIHWIDALGLLGEWSTRFARPWGSEPTDSAIDQVVEAAFARTFVERALLWQPTYYDSVVTQLGNQFHVSAPQRTVEWMVDELSTQRSWATDTRVASPPRPVKDRLELLGREMLARSEDERRAFRRATFDNAEVSISRTLIAAEAPFRLDVLDPSDMIQGVPVAAIIDVWHALWALACARESVAISLYFPHTEALDLTPSFIVRRALEAGRGRSRTADCHRAVELLTLDASKIYELNAQAAHSDHGIHPLVRTSDGRVLLVHGLVLENNVERVLLRLAAQDSRAFLKVLSERVNRGRDLAQALRASITDESVLMATEVPMKRGKKDETDLDIVLVDPLTRRGLLVEVAGGIIPASFHEFGDKDREIARKIRVQVPVQQRGMRDSAVSVPFPADWPNRFEIDWQWAVAGPTYLGLDLRDSDLFEVSAQTADLFGPFADLGHMIEAHRNPRFSERWSSTTTRFETLGYSFTVEALEPAAR